MADWIVSLLYIGEYRADRGTVVLVSRWPWLRLKERDAKAREVIVFRHKAITTQFAVRDRPGGVSKV
jgi:hypothetical protein